MRYFKLTIAYDGTDFHGWQIQAEKPTIQGEIVNVLRRLTQEHVYLHGAGRTDAGVHALGQVGSFRTQSALSAEEFQRALNALLPQTIRIVGSEEVGPDFDARWSVRGNSFLRYMVRKMVGTLLDVGRGRLKPEDIDRLFELRDRSKSGPTVPPQGLVMVEVQHEEAWRLGRP